MFATWQNRHGFQNSKSKTKEEIFAVTGTVGLGLCGRKESRERRFIGDQALTGRLHVKSCASTNLAQLHLIKYHEYFLLVLRNRTAPDQ